MPSWVELVGDALTAAGDRVIAIDAEATTLTARELRHQVGGAVDLLDRAGIRAGHTVPALITMRPASLALVLAGATTGRPLAPLSGRLTVHELAQCLEGLDGPVVLAEPQWAQVGRELAERCGRELVVVDGVAATAPVPLSAPTDSIAFVLHTSGTTGRPRRVDVRQDRMAMRSVSFGRVMRFSPDCVYVASSPFHHIGGL